MRSKLNGSNGRLTRVVAMVDHGEAHRHGLLQSAIEEFLEGTRSLANLVGSVGSGALGAIPEPLPATVTRMLMSLQQLIEHAPPLTAELEILVQELHAKRLTVQALQAELSAFDHQLGVLESSLAPMENWVHQWARLRESLTETLRSTPPEPASPAD
jgi:hypothetical protein